MRQIQVRHAGQWKLLIICPDRELFQQVTGHLSELIPTAAVVDLPAYPQRRSLHDLLSVQPPTLCFLDVASDRDKALAALQEIGQLRPDLPVVALHHSNNPDLILLCLRQGAREFLFTPFSADQIAGALERLSKHLTVPAAGPSAKVFCVIPGKGASGASTVACGLAYHLKRLKPEEKVLLADLDPTTGTISFQLKLRSQYSFVDVLSNSSNLDESIWSTVVASYQGIDILLSPESPVDSLAESREVATLIHFARERYQWVVLDSKSPYGEWGLTIARNADEILLVTTNELPMLHAAQRAIAHLDRSGIERSRIRLIVNRHNSEAGLGREAIEMALHLDVYEVLPNDYDSVQKSLLDGKPVLPNSPLGKGLGNLASRLSGVKPGTSARKSWFSFRTLFDR